VQLILQSFGLWQRLARENAHHIIIHYKTTHNIYELKPNRAGLRYSIPSSKVTYRSCHRCCCSWVRRALSTAECRRSRERTSSIPSCVKYSFRTALKTEPKEHDVQIVSKYGCALPNNFVID